MPNSLDRTVGKMVPYNTSHWRSTIRKYQAADWSKAPSYFAKLVKPYLNPESKILELGAGAGQDGLWFESEGFDATISDGDDMAFEAIEKRSNGCIKPVKFDIQSKFPFENNSFDVVYAQLVLHYFDDDTMHSIINEIKRVLKPNGILACMVNSTCDPEYDKSLEDNSGLINVDGLVKRYFSVGSFTPFIKDFEPLLFDNKGRTPKDDAVNTSGMIQFIGALK